MQSFEFRELVNSAVHICGAQDFDERPLGISPRRLPSWTRNQVPQPFDVVARMPSGVRVRFQTNSTSVGITFHATNMVTPPNARRPIPFSLETDGTIHRLNSDKGNTIVLNANDRTDFKLERGDPDTITFKNLPSRNKTCELWLPHNAFIELRDLHIDDGSSLTLAPNNAGMKWTHYGSSISHCMEADDPAMIWPAVAARICGLNLNNLGFGGQCHLDQFVARTIRDSDAELISIKTGINIINADSMKERVFTPTLHGFLDTVREGKLEQPIVLLSSIYCPSAEVNRGPTIPDKSGRFVTIPGSENLRDGSMTLVRTREILEKVVQDRQDKNLIYLDGLQLFSKDDAMDLPDDLHPNPAGYVRMGERFAALLPTLVPTIIRQ